MLGGLVGGIHALVASAKLRSSSDKVSSESAGTKPITVSNNRTALFSHAIGGSTFG